MKVTYGFASKKEGMCPPENTCFGELGTALGQGGAGVRLGEKSFTEYTQGHNRALEIRLWIPTQLGPGS